MTMTTQAQTLFEMPAALPKVGQYVAIGQSAGKVLRYEDNQTAVVIEQQLAGEKFERRFAVSALNPQPLPEPVVARQAFEVVVEGDTEDDVTQTVQRLQAVLAMEGIQTEQGSYEEARRVRTEPAAKPEWEVKILRQVIDSGDQDHHEAELAALLNDGWKIIDMKSSRIKGRSIAMLVVVYLKRRKPAAPVPPVEGKAEALENVSSDVPEVVDLNSPGAVAAMLTEYFEQNPDDVPPEETPDTPPAPQPVTLHPMNRMGFQTIHEPDRPVILPDVPVNPQTFDEALLLHDAGKITTEELLEFGDRQAMSGRRETFIGGMMEYQTRMSTLALPMLPASA